jgi:hypothetical protein
VRQAPGYHDTVGMRLGHGMRTETPKTRIWFVTTGYLVRLLAHHPEIFNDHTHLVIDEVKMLLLITTTAYSCYLVCCTVNAVIILVHVKSSV